MARPTYVYSIDHVARMIDESLELIEVISWNSDNTDYGEMIQVLNGTDKSLADAAPHHALEHASKKIALSKTAMAIA